MFRARVRYRTRIARELGPKAGVLASGRFLVASRRGLLTALRARDGHILWTRRMQARPGASLGATTGALFYGDWRGRLIALHPDTGKVLWRAHVLGAVTTRPISARGNLVVVGTRAGRLVALRRGQGTQAWHLAIRRPFTALAPLPNGDVVALAMDRRVRRVDGATGRVLWNQPLPNSAIVPPAVDRQALYVLGAAGRLQRLDARTGKVLWRREGFGFRSPGPVLSSGGLLVASRERLLHCVDPVRGGSRWIKPLGAIPTASPAVRGTTAFTVTAAPALLAIRTDTGGHYLKIPLPDRALTPPTPLPNGVLVFDRAGRATRYELTDAPWRPSKAAPPPTRKTALEPN